MARKPKPTPAPRRVTTLDEARQLRETCEQHIQLLLRQLCVDTGMDLRRVEVHCIAHDLRDEERPQVIPMAVRIDLTV